VDPVELHTQKMEDVYHQIRELQTSFRNKQSVCFSHACFAQMLVAWF
jgi:nitrate/nitrite-specific signal transduction histidine kinase